MAKFGFGFGAPAMGPLAGFGANNGQVMQSRGRPSYAPGAVQSQPMMMPGQGEDVDDLLAFLQAQATGQNRPPAAQHAQPGPMPPQAAAPAQQSSANPIQAPNDRGMFGRFMGGLGKAVGKAGEFAVYGPVGMQIRGDQRRQREQEETESARRQQMLSEYLADPSITPQMRQLALLSPDQFFEQSIQKQFAPAPEPYTLAPGARRYGADGNLIAENPVSEKPVTPFSTIGKLAADLQSGRITPEQYDLEIARMQRADPSLAIQFNEGGALSGITYGSAPKGQESAIVRGPGGQPVVSPGPQQEQFRKADSFLKSKQRQIGIVRDDIRRATELVQDPMATGPMGLIGRELPIVGAITPGGRLASRIKTIKTNIGFDKLDEMRQNSPTGGALGNVTEKEIDFLQAVAGELDNAQSDEDVTYILNRIDAFYLDLERQYQEAFALDYPTLQDEAQFRAQTNQQVQDLNGLYAPDGGAVTEDDIRETMAATGMTREQIIARLRGQ